MTLNQNAKIQERIEELLNNFNYDPAQDLEKGIQYANPIQRMVCEILDKEFPNKTTKELVDISTEVMKKMRTNYEMKNRYGAK